MNRRWPIIAGAFAAVGLIATCVSMPLVGLFALAGSTWAIIALLCLSVLFIVIACFAMAHDEEGRTNPPKYPAAKCPRCKYDLRAHDITAGCPECGWGRER